MHYASRLATGRDTAPGAFWRRLCDAAFVRIFVLYMFVDFGAQWFGLLVLDKMMVAHHVGCLVGHTVACWSTTRAYAYYFAGVLAR